MEDAAVRALAAAGQTLGTVEIGTEGRLAACLAQAEARRQGQARSPTSERMGPKPQDPSEAVYCGGIVLPAVGHETAVSVKTLAERARMEQKSTLGLAVGAVGPGPDGRTVVAIALSDGRQVDQIEHMLGGGPALALSRAAKTAIDLVRRKCEDRTAAS